MVGTCEACGQPLTAAPTSGIARVDWRVPLDVGAIHIGADGTVRGPDGPLDIAEAKRKVWAATAPLPWYRRMRLGRSIFQAGVLLGLVGPLTAFLLAVLALSIFVGPAVEEWRKVGEQVWEYLR